jgi:hypothetical protein
MKKREGLLLENKILLAAVYIDLMNRILFELIVLHKCYIFRGWK